MTLTKCVFCDKDIDDLEPSINYMKKKVCVNCTIGIIQDIMHIYYGINSGTYKAAIP